MRQWLASPTSCMRRRDNAVYNITFRLQTFLHISKKWYCPQVLIFPMSTVHSCHYGGVYFVLTDFILLNDRLMDIWLTRKYSYVDQLKIYFGLRTLFEDNIIAGTYAACGFEIHLQRKQTQFLIQVKSFWNSILYSNLIIFATVCSSCNA